MAAPRRQVRQQEAAPEAGLAPRPRNPFFVTSINVRRKNELYIPMDLVKRMSVRIPKRIVLVDQRRREYQLRRKEWNGGRLLYVDGWKHFRRDNHVHERDEIILKFVNSKIRAVIIRAQ